MATRGGLQGILDRTIFPGEHSSKKEGQHREKEQHAERNKDAEERNLRASDDDSEATGQGNQVEDNRRFPPLPDSSAQLPPRNVNR